jgi:hypothetical protein
MKSPKMLFLILFLFLLVTTKAEKIPFCQALVKIIESSDKEFADIRLSEMKSETLVYKYGSSIEIAEATDSYLKKIASTMTYTSEFGKFTSEDAAKIKINELKTVLSKCFSTIDFVSYYEPLFNTFHVDLLSKGEKGFLYYNSGFRIKKYGNSYELVFEYAAAEKKGYGSNAAFEPVYSEYIYIDKQQNTTQFSLDIRKLIADAKTAFVTHKAEEIEADFALFKNFKSKFNPTGFSECYIEDRGMNIINFVIPVTSGITLEQAEKFQQEYIDKLQYALGSNYAFNYSRDGYVISFVNKLQPQKEIVQIVFTYNSGNYDMNLHIVADR